MIEPSCSATFIATATWVASLIIIQLHVLWRRKDCINGIPKVSQEGGRDSPCWRRYTSCAACGVLHLHHLGPLTSQGMQRLVSSRLDTLVLQCVGGGAQRLAHFRQRRVQRELHDRVAATNLMFGHPHWCGTNKHNTSSSRHGQSARLLLQQEGEAA